MEEVGGDAQNDPQLIQCPAPAGHGFHLSLMLVFPNKYNRTVVCFETSGSQRMSTADTLQAISNFQFSSNYF
jgi:hypothetical protein